MDDNNKGPLLRTGGVNYGINVPPNEDTIRYLEGNIPFQKDRDGAIVRGNMPSIVLERYWSLLNHHVSLANLTAQLKRVYFWNVRGILMTKIGAIPEENFSLEKLEELEEVEATNFLQMTKSISESGRRDRELVVSDIHLQESREVFTEQKDQPKSWVRRLI